MQAGWFTQAFGSVMDRLVHDDARRDRRQREAHVRFIAVRVLCGCLTCACLPIYILMRASLSTIEITLLVSATLLLVPAAVVARTGNLRLGHDLSSALLSSSIALVAMQSGGLQSPAIPLFAIVMLDAAVSGSRRALSGAGLASMVGLLATMVVSPAGEPALLSPKIVSAMLVIYALVIAWIFVNRDERHTSSQIRSQARATAALDTVSDVVLWREANGNFSFANSAAHHQLGLDRRDFSDALLFERVNVGDRPAYLKALADAAHGAGHGQALIRISVDQGDARHVRMFEMSARCVGPADLEDAVVVGLRDVTERHATDALRESARQEAERNARSKSKFLATMSHELRTPLNAIIGFSELLTQSGMLPPADPRRDEYARIINGSGLHLLEVVNAILDMSKIESGMMVIEQEPVSLAQVVQSSRELLAVRATEHAVSLTENIPADLPDIISDRRALKQILLNLMSNAVKFTPSGGDVSITAVRDREHVEIVVADTGCGIAEADLSQLGSPFFQARQSYDREHEGTGLGLSVVRGLVGLLGGSLLIESAPDAGTRVVIRLAIAGHGSLSSTEPVCITTRIRARRPALDALAAQHPLLKPQGLAQGGRLSA